MISNLSQILAWALAAISSFLDTETPKHSWVGDEVVLAQDFLWNSIPLQPVRLPATTTMTTQVPKQHFQEPCTMLSGNFLLMGFSSCTRSLCGSTVPPGVLFPNSQVKPPINASLSSVSASFCPTLKLLTCQVPDKKPMIIPEASKGCWCFLSSPPMLSIKASFPSSCYISTISLYGKPKHLCVPVF